jgi:hypothetical protein
MNRIWSEGRALEVAFWTKGMGVQKTQGNSCVRKIVS